MTEIFEDIKEQGVKEAVGLKRRSYGVGRKWHVVHVGAEILRSIVAGLTSL